jgi:hypothetical protein
MKKLFGRLPERGASRTVTYERKEGKDVVTRDFGLNFSARKGYPRGKRVQRKAQKAKAA